MAKIPKRMETMEIPIFAVAEPTAICEPCGRTYEEHPNDMNHLDWDGRPYLRKLCNGKLVKLNRQK